jgi:hypothetical protein
VFSYSIIYSDTFSQLYHDENKLLWWDDVCFVEYQLAELNYNGANLLKQHVYLVEKYRLGYDWPQFEDMILHMLPITFTNKFGLWCLTSLSRIFQL